MKLSVFTKLFLVYIFFVIIPIALVMILIILNYEQSIERFLNEENRIVVPLLFQSLYLSLIGLKIQIILALILVIFLSLAGSILFTGMILRPLKKLRKGVEELNKGNFDFKINMNLKDEFGELINFFNKTTFYLKTSNDSLQKTKDFFENQTLLRTQELKKLIKTRDDTISRKTKELQERVNELEIVHRLAANRELKMAELKEKIMELEKGLNKKKL